MLQFGFGAHRGCTVAGCLQHVHQVFVQQSSQHPAVSEDPLSIELDLADFVVGRIERVKIDVIQLFHVERTAGTAAAHRVGGGDG